MRNLSLFLLILFLAVSCGKTNRVTIQGRVLNPVTGEGIEGAKIILMKYTGGLPAGTKTVSSAYSASDGFFEVSAKGLLKNFTADCILDGYTYHRIGWMKDGKKYTILSPKLGKITHADYYAVPFGEMILSINNVNCGSSNDSMQFNSFYQFQNVDDGYSSYRIGCYSYTSEGFQVPTGYHYYKTKVTRSGITSYVYDTILVSTNNTGVLQIDY